MRWRQAAVLAGVATVLVFLFAGAVGALHGAPASAGRSALGAVSAGLRPSQVSAPAPSCPFSGPLGGLNTGEAVGVLAATFVFGMGGGIGVYRIVTTGRHGGYIAREGADGATTIGSATGGSGAGKISISNSTDLAARKAGGSGQGASPYEGSSSPPPPKDIVVTKEQIVVTKPAGDTASSTEFEQ